MSQIRFIVRASMIVLTVVGQLLAEECDELRTAGAEDLVTYLNENLPNEDNGRCVAFAIYKIGDQRFELAVPVLVRLLDFRRPLNEREKRGFHVRMQGFYPAVDALEQIGKAALPSVLEAIESEATSDAARENAVLAWMEVYKSERPKGLAVLRQEIDRAQDPTWKQHLNWAISKALTWCNPAEEVQCKKAARSGKI